MGKKQEKQRQERNEKKRVEEEAGVEEAEKQWRKSEKEKEKKRLQDEKERTRTQKRKAGRKGRAEEWQVLAREECLAKRLRNGKITVSQFSKGVNSAANPKGKDGLPKSKDDESGSDESGDDVADASWIKRR